MEPDRTTLHEPFASWYAILARLCSRCSAGEESGFKTQPGSAVAAKGFVKHVQACHVNSQGLFKSGSDWRVRKRASFNVKTRSQEVGLILAKRESVPSESLADFQPAETRTHRRPALQASFTPGTRTPPPEARNQCIQDMNDNAPGLIEGIK